MCAMKERCCVCISVSESKHQLGVCIGRVKSGYEDFLTQPTMVSKKKEFNLT